MNKTGLLYVLVALASGMAGYLLFQAGTNSEIKITSTANNNSGAAKSLTGMTRPGFSLPDLEGRPHSPVEWNDKILILNFWASWCPPCLQEIPAFIRLQQKYAGRDVQFVGIALQRAEEIREFVVTQGINYPVLAGEAEVINVAEQYGNLIGTLPYTVFIDQKQRIAYIKSGPISEIETEKVLDSLVIIN